MARHTLKVCPCLGCDAHPGTCPTLTPDGRCDPCTRTADLSRGTSTTRGYNTPGHRSFREAVLTRDPFCTIRGPRCTSRSTVADHWPVSRRDLERAGTNPNDPQHGRGVCKPCHDAATARNQPGGWHQP